MREYNEFLEGENRGIEHEKERILKLLDEIENPYPTSIFPEPTKKQYKIFDKILEEHGMTLARFSGAVGRALFDGMKVQFSQKIKGEE